MQNKPPSEPLASRGDNFVLDKYRIDGILGLLQMHRESVLTLSNYAIYFNGTEFEVRVSLGDDAYFASFSNGRDAIDYVLRDEIAANVELPKDEREK